MTKHVGSLSGDTIVELVIKLIPNSLQPTEASDFVPFSAWIFGIEETGDAKPDGTDLAVTVLLSPMESRNRFKDLSTCGEEGQTPSERTTEP